jgi:hypothetical protein
MPLDSTSMSPRRLGPPSNTFNYFEDTVEMALTAQHPGHHSCRKRQRRLGTAAINDSRPSGSPSRMTMTASSLHRVVLGQRRT